MESAENELLKGCNILLLYAMICFQVIQGLTFIAANRCDDCWVDEKAFKEYGKQDMIFN